MRPIVITVFDSETGTTSEHTFTTSPVRIGRNPLNDLSLPFPFVSGWHAIVRFEDDAARFFDLGSTNGTLLDNRRVQAGEPVEIQGVVSVTIGKLELRLSRGGGYTSAPQPTPAGQPQLQQPWPTQQAPRPSMPGSIQPTAAWQVVAASGTIDPGRAHAPAPQGTAHVPMSEIHDAIARIRGQYDEYRRAWGTLLGGIHQTLGTMDPGARQFALSIMQRELPGITGEPEMTDLLAQAGVAITPSPRAAASSGDDVGLVAKLSDALRPGEDPPRSPQEATRFLQCVEDVMRASAKAFVELQKGQEQFGNEMGVRTIKEFTPLHAAGNAENVLKYLLDWQVGGPHRTQELVGVYADLMIHQVALINGVMEGARGLLARLDPGQIERAVTAAWPTRGAALWRHYMQKHRELMESERSITEAVFGPEFARAYAEVGGEGSRRG
jgi:type VI secretion system protein